MKENVTRATNSAEPVDILDNAGFVVDMHDGDQLRVVTHCRLQVLRRQQTVCSGS
jgi:hypothetical protein